MTRHPVEALSLGTGFAFLAFALAYIIGTAIGAPPSALVALPLLFVGLGASALGALLVSQNRSTSATASDDTPQTVDR